MLLLQYMGMGMRHIIFLSLALCGFLVFSLASSAAFANKSDAPPKVFTSPEELELVAVGIVKEIPTPHKILLQDGTTYVLDNIRVPAQYEALAIGYLKSILIGKEIGVFMNPNSKETRVDQSGNKIGHVMTAEAGWVQASLITQGLAYAFSQRESNVLTTELYKYEEMARRTNAGFWQNPLYAVRTRETIKDAVGSYQVFEDVVDDIRSRGEYASLIFGKEIPADFSVLIRKDESDRATVPLGNLHKARIRVHGWVENNNGTIMHVNHAEQIEVLNHKPQKKTPECLTGDLQARRTCMTQRRETAQ